MLGNVINLLTTLHDGASLSSQRLQEECQGLHLGMTLFHPVDELDSDHPPTLGNLVQVNMHGANVTSWRRPDGLDILHMRPDSPFDGTSPIL